MVELHVSGRANNGIYISEDSEKMVNLSFPIGHVYRFVQINWKKIYSESRIFLSDILICRHVTQRIFGKTGN